jgi:hypothetical protein
MAHRTNIAIPARFVFRPFTAEWNWTRATIFSWGEEFPELRNLVMLSNKGKVKHTSESVIVHIAIWRGRGYLGEFDDYFVEMKRGELPPDCLRPHENPESTPDIKGREFDLLVCRLPPMKELGSSVKPEEMVRDAWEMREEFFAIRGDLNATNRFLNRWGLWNFQLVSLAPPDNGLFSGTLISPHRLWTLCDTYIKAAAGSPRSWLTTAAPLSLKESEKRPYFIVERSYCEDAIKATITIDHLAKVKFGICKRHDCRRLFKRTTQQKRLYCSPECAHLANVRKLRAQKKKTEPKGRKHATRKD